MVLSVLRSTPWSIEEDRASNGGITQSIGEIVEIGKKSGTVIVLIVTAIAVYRQDLSEHRLVWAKFHRFSNKLP